MQVNKEHGGVGPNLMGLIHTKMYKSLQDDEADKYREGRPNRQLIQQGPIKNRKNNQARYRKTKSQKYMENYKQGKGWNTWHKVQRWTSTERGEHTA